MIKFPYVCHLFVMLSFISNDFYMIWKLRNVVHLSFSVEENGGAAPANYAIGDKKGEPSIAERSNVV